MNSKPSLHAYMPGCHMHSHSTSRDDGEFANNTSKSRCRLPFSFLQQERKMKITEEKDSLKEEDEEESEILPTLSNYGMYKSCGSIDRLSYLLKDKPIKTEKLKKSQSVLSLNDDASCHRIGNRDHSSDLHSLELGGMRNNPNTAWIFAIPSKITKHKACDEVSEDFRKAGIGSCFRGEASIISK